MTAANQQIVTCFEDLGMKPEEIAADQELDLVAVKAILMQFSAQYRRACKTDDSLNFSDDEEVAANQTIVRLMRYAEDERLQLRAAMYIRDDRKGRLDVVKQMSGLNVNVLMFNEQLAKATKALNRSKGLEAIDVNSQVAEATK